MTAPTTKPTTRLTRRAFACLALGAWVLAAPCFSFAQSPTPAPLSARRFSVVLRVVRPKWRDTNAVPMPIHPHLLTGTQFTIKHADSDAEFLKELRVNNAFFTFDAVVNKRVLTLRGDQGWQAPADFTYQTLWLGVVDNDREMLRNYMSDPKPAGAQQGTLTMSGSPAVHAGTPPDYLFDLTEKAQRDLMKKGMLLLSYRYKSVYMNDDVPVEYQGGNLIHFINNGDTVCILGSALPVLGGSGNLSLGTSKNELLMPSDVVFVTVTEIK